MFERGALPVLASTDKEYLRSLGVTVDIRLSSSEHHDYVAGAGANFPGARVLWCAIPPAPPTCTAAGTPAEGSQGRGQAADVCAAREALAGSCCTTLALDPASASAFGQALHLLAAVFKSDSAGVAQGGGERGRRTEPAVVAVGSLVDDSVTAWCSALLLLAVGVTEAAVVADYSKGAVPTSKTTTHAHAHAHANTPTSARHPTTLSAALAAAKDKGGGTMDAYIRTVLGVSDRDRAVLQAALVAPLPL